MRRKILVADDEPLITSLIARALDRDHDVTCVADGTEVVRRITEGERYDVIFCDLMMPGMGGIVVYWELGMLAAEQAQRMVFLTGGAITPADQAFLDRVPQPCLEKPFNLATLRAALERVPPPTG